jgi:hypothetical protein
MRKSIWVLIIVVVAGAIGILAWQNATNTPAPTDASAPAPAVLAASSTAQVVGPGERCGGNMLNPPTCTAGYHCAPDPNSHLPFGDVGGTCAPDVNGGKG